MSKNKDELKKFLSEVFGKSFVEETSAELDEAMTKKDRTIIIEEKTKEKSSNVSNDFIPELELIEYAKKYLKERGYKKKNKRWTKIEDEFTISFLIQGSNYSKKDYYIRPGIFINPLGETELYYGHFMTQLTNENIESTFKEFEEFVQAWTNKTKIRSTVEAFIEWEKRNPLEKRRAGLSDYEKDPYPSSVCFRIPKEAIEYILNNY